MEWWHYATDVRRFICSKKHWNLAAIHKICKMGLLMSFESVCILVQHYEIGFRQYDSTNVHCSAWSPPSRKRIVWQSGRTLRKKTNQHVFFRRCVFQKVQVHEQQSSRKCLWIPSPSHENQPLSNPIPIKHPNGPNSSQWCGNSIHPPWFRPPAFPKASLTGALSSVASHPYGFDKQDLYPIILNHIDHYI